jgi:cyclohexadienyl dehydratase
MVKNWVSAELGVVVGSVALALAGLGCERSNVPAAEPRADASAAPTSARPAASELARAPEPPHARWRVGTTGDYAPFSRWNGSGEPSGFDVDVARALGSDLGVELEWVRARWPTLESALAAGEFDVAMTGVTWQPARSVTGYMTRAVARGGPCVLGDAHGTPVGVNHGGVLEAWARTRFPESALVTVDDNQSLPGLLASGKVRAIVTDSFELSTFARPGWTKTCEPRLARKVYWVAPGHEALARTLDAWLLAHPDRVEAAQERWFGERQPLRPLDHLADLLARRLAFMPLVAAAKLAAGLPIEDLPREKVVLDSAAAEGTKFGLPVARVRAFFALQIELAKAVQRRQWEATTLDLGRQMRPALNELGDRILDALRAARQSGELAQVTVADLEPVTPFLEPAELGELVTELRAFAGE